MTLTEMKAVFDAKTEELTRLADKGNDVTSAEYERAKTLHAEAKQLQADIAKAQERKGYADAFRSIGPRTIDGVEYPDASTTSKGAPSLAFTQQDIGELQKAAKAGQFFRKTVDTTDSPMSAVPAYLPGVYPFLRDRVRLLDSIPVETISAPAVFYNRATAPAAGATPVSEGSPKPESSPTWEQVPLPVTKLAHFVRVNDEVISDYSGFSQLIQTELIAGLIDVENDQILNGTGTPPEFQGILTTGDLQTRDIGSDSVLDSLLRAATDLRTGDAFCEPDTVIINPADFEEIRLSKAEGSGEYLLGNPLSSSAPSLNGAAFKVTTRIDQGTAIVANLGEATRAYVNEFPRVEVHPHGGGTDESIANQTLIRAEERMAAVAIIRPAAIVVVTLAAS
ncbi:MAG: phage major capsid protein [Actinomycetota bacterium]|nr:phage major capsid protein [Actinomycetota bacterium]